MLASDITPKNKNKLLLPKKLTNVGYNFRTTNVMVKAALNVIPDASPLALAGYISPSSVKGMVSKPVGEKAKQIASIIIRVIRETVAEPNCLSKKRSLVDLLL